MILKHTHKQDGTCTFSEIDKCKDARAGFWEKEPVDNIIQFCTTLDYSLEILSATHYKLVKN